MTVMYSSNIPTSVTTISPHHYMTTDGTTDVCNAIENICQQRVTGVTKRYTHTQKHLEDVPDHTISSQDRVPIPSTEKPPEEQVCSKHFRRL